MSTQAPLVGIHALKNNTSSTQATNNPFETDFDEESDGEWWDEEDSIPFNSTKPTAAARVTQWPRPAESTGAGNLVKPLARTGTNKIEKRYSVHKPRRDKSKGRQKKLNALAGIKVITNSSKNPAVPAALQPAQVQPSRAIPHMGHFVDLAALEALNGGLPQSSGGFWKSRKNKDLTRAANTMPSLDDSQSAPANGLESNKSKGLAPPPSPLQMDLSPCDRPIVIGLSIPSARLAEHNLSPQTASSDTSKILQSYEHRTPTNLSPETPTIIITPAQASNIWSALEDNPTSAGPFARPTSSIYSQASHNAIRIYTQQNAPPVPQMPAAVLKSERQRIAAQKSYFSPDSDEGTSWETDDDTGRDAKSRSRAFSSCTVFEEDESPVIVRAGRTIPVSAESKDVKHASISTVATRRRSKGWWNYITTPFLTRSNTVATRGVFEDQEPPALPNLAIAATKAQEAEREGNMWEKQFSPLTPQTTTTISSDSWWDTSAKEDQSKHQQLEEQSPTIRETRHKVEPSSGTLPFVLSEVAGLGGNTMSTLHTSSTQSELDHNMSGPDTQALPNRPETRGIQSNNPFVQPRLNDLTNRSDNSQPPRIQEIQPVPPVLARPPVAPSPPPPYSPNGAQIPRYRAILPPARFQNLQYPASPGPISPGLHQAMSSGGGIPMSNVPLTPASQRPTISNSPYSDRSTRQTPMAFDPPPLQALSKKAQKAEAKRRRNEKEDAIARRAGGWWRGRGCIPDRGCYGRSGPEGRKKRRCYIGLIVGFLIMIILVISLATTLHRKSNTIVGPSQWLNLTGFPPIFTGLSTVAAPVNIKTNTGCVFPATQWSCDLPKELQASVAPNPSNQPNFLLQIQWDNSSATNATFANVTRNPQLGTRQILGNPVSAGQFIKSMLLKTRQIVTFAPNPAPPSFAEEFFLGNTTDGVVSDNKAGEPTPFYISFLQTTGASGSKRQVLARDSTQFPNATEGIPPPSLNPDGTAAPANLLPLPFQQPIRLYDRGLGSEHYGFYTYFDRSIFLKSITPLNDTNLSNGAVPDDENGGATEAEAAFRCTWAETRFLVQMWTRMNGTTSLDNATSSTNLGGTNFTQPGTFPYPITITVDRHGGDITRKMLYCYDMNDREGIISTGKYLVGENRAFGGQIINPAPNVFSNQSDPSLGGFDGGTSGCSCQWSNFQNVV